MRISPFVAAAALLIASPVAAQDTAARYTVDFTVMKAGSPIASARTLIAEGGQAEASLITADGAFMFTADLQPEQGDGDESRLVLEAYINHEGDDLANPRLIMRRGGSAMFQLGSSSDASDALQDGWQVSLTPAPD